MHYSHMAEHVRSRGRGDDTMLIHMTPNEVGGLQQLALATGGSLTINPDTGLPEAGWLGKLLPIIAGIGLNFLLPGVGSAIGGALGGIGGAAGTGVLVGAGTTAITGDLKQGLMAGLGAFGGASLAGGLQGAIGGAAAPTAATAAAPVATTAAGTTAAAAAPVATTAATTAAKTGLGGFMQGFANTAKGLPLTGATAPAGFFAKAAVPLAISGAYGGVSNAFAPSGGGGTQQGAVDNSYGGPYYNDQRKVIATPAREELTNPAFSGERTWFNNSVPGVYNAQGQMVQPGSDTAPGTPIMMPVLNTKAKKGEPMYSFTSQPWMGDIYAQQQREQQQQMGYADGGPVHMSAGSFVMPARETAEFGNGSTEAGQRVLSGLGGIPIRGAGDGTSDDIRASIGGHEARVADGEVHFPPEAVRRIGKGSDKRGTDKLYAMMKRAEQSRKQAARGGNGLNVAKGISAL